MGAHGRAPRRPAEARPRPFAACGRGEPWVSLARRRCPCHLCHSADENGFFKKAASRDRHFVTPGAHGLRSRHPREAVQGGGACSACGLWVSASRPSAAGWAGPAVTSQPGLAVAAECRPSVHSGGHVHPQRMARGRQIWLCCLRRATLQDPLLPSVTLAAGWSPTCFSALSSASGVTTAP